MTRLRTVGSLAKKAVGGDWTRCLILILLLVNGGLSSMENPHISVVFGAVKLPPDQVLDMGAVPIVDSVTVKNDGILRVVIIKTQVVFSAISESHPVKLSIIITDESLRSLRKMLNDTAANYFTIEFNGVRVAVPRLVSIEKMTNELICNIMDVPALEKVIASSALKP